MHCRLRRRALLLATALVGACSPGTPALEFSESFERDWSAPGAATCRGGHATFVRRVAGGGCAPGGSLHWSGAPAREHGAPVCAGDRSCEGAAVAVHRFDTLEPGGDPIGLVNGGVLEIFSSRRTQSRASGRLRVDLHVHEPVPVSGAGEHYLILHNLTLAEASCPRDCPEVPHTATNQGTGPQRYRWYGVIGGAFGEPADTDSPIRAGSVGFAVEVPRAVSAAGDRPNDLVDESFLPYSVGGAGKAFPAGWYRISLERGPRHYRYSVLRWNGEAFEPIVPDDAAAGGTHEREFDVERLVAPLGRPLPEGYVGLGVAWFGGAGRRGAHVDWDDFVVDW